MSEVLAISQTGGGFALFIAFLLVTVEDLGVERTIALPIKESVRTLSKVIISTISYVPVVCALAVILFTKPSTFDYAMIVPLAALGSVFAACVVEIVVLRALTVRGRGAATRFVAGIGSGEFIIFTPALIYTFEYVLSRNHAISIEALTVISLAELVLAAVILKLIPYEPRSRIDT